MREEIDEWVAEGRSETQSDRPLVLLDVIGVVGDSTPDDPEESAPDDNEPALKIPSYMPALVRHLVDVAEVRWGTPLDDELADQLTVGLGIGSLAAIEADARRCDDFEVRVADGHNPPLRRQLNLRLRRRMIAVLLRRRVVLNHRRRRIA